MSERVASLYVEVTAKTDGVTSGLSSVKSQMSSAREAALDFVHTVETGFAAAGIAGAALGQVFEFGAWGAGISQTESSFNQLISTMDGAPDTLEQLRAATQNTVSDLQLMSGVNLMLAGTTGELAQALLTAAPELAEIATAASQINPAAGSAAEAFGRLAAGIKKAEPELLDELGIVVNLNQVYSEYAASLGKSSNELSKTEQAQAMLNAVLDKGSIIVNQAAGAMDENYRATQQAAAAYQNAKEDLAEFVGVVQGRAIIAVQQLGQILTGMRPALDAQNQALATSTMSQEEYAKAMNEAANAAGLAINANGDLVGALFKAGDGMGRVVEENYLLSEAEREAARAALEQSGATSALASAVEGLEGSLGAATAAQDMLNFSTLEQANSWSVYGERLQAAYEASGEFQILTVALAASIAGELQSATDTYNDSLSDLVTEEADLTAQLQELQAAGISPTSEKYQELTQAIRTNQAAQDEALTSLQATAAAMVYQQAAAGLDAQAALDLGRAMGQVSEADYAVATAVESLRVAFDTNHDTMISAAEGAQDYAASVLAVNNAVQSLQAKGLPVTLDNIAKEMESLAQTGATSELEDTASAATDASSPLADVAGAASDAAGATGDLASSTDDQNQALEQVQGAANRARIGIDSVRTAASNASGPLRIAATAAGNLADALERIPHNNNIRVTTSGFDAAIAAVNSLSRALNSVPSDVTATVSVNFQDAGGGGSTGGTSGTSGGTSGTNSTTPTLSQTFNVYNPLAAAMLIEQQANNARQRMEALMNG